ncbi:hypothetical protein D7Y55_03135 [Stenotrophomonas maltophilia]|nr:hypothetical protein [Stenotrophomonas maltophilia]
MSWMQDSEIGRNGAASDQRGTKPVRSLAKIIVIARRTPMGGPDLLLLLRADGCGVIFHRPLPLWLMWASASAALEQ